LGSQDGEATDDPARAAADLSVAVARLQAGASVRYAGQSLFYLTAAEYRLGAWDDALLHGSLAVARGDMDGAEESFVLAGHLARSLSLPFQIAMLERDDGRRLRRAGDRQGAVACLRKARGQLASMGARPYVAACDRELQACGAEVAPGAGLARWNLTASEAAAARLVATGRSNREVAAELFVSVKAVEFHLGTSSTRSGSGPAGPCQDVWQKLRKPLREQPRQNIGPDP
jgi:DNA-binding NarL/FixJ family response regulator